MIKRMRNVYLWKGIAVMAFGLIMAGCSSSEGTNETPILTEEEAMENAEEQLGITIAPDKSWQMTKEVAANISTHLGLDQEYTVALYNSNPLYSENVTFYGETTIKEGASANMTITIPTSDSLVYATVYDSKQRRLTLYARVENNTVDFDFGGSGSSASAPHRASQTDADAAPYAHSFNDYLNYPKENSWDPNPEIIDASTMSSWTAFTDADIIAANSNGNSWSRKLDELVWNNDNSWYLCNGDGRHYRIDADTEVTESFTMKGSTRNQSVIYVEGTLHVANVEFSGATIVVGPTGRLILDGDLNLSNSGRFLVMDGGEITKGSIGSSVKLVVSNGSPCYNAGDINAIDILDLNGSDFYNCGNVNVDVFKQTANGSKLTNFGIIDIRTTTSVANGHNQDVINGCYINVTENFGCKKLVMLNNSRLDVGWTFYNANSEYSSDKNELHNASVISVGNMMGNSAAFFGPTAQGEFAIIKMDTLMVNQTTDFKALNNAYVDLNNQNIVKYDKSPVDLSDISYWGKVVEYFPKTISETSSAFIIPDGECTGSGYNPNGGTTPVVPQNYPTYTYAFEDTNGGDYDMNDVVIKVQEVVVNNAHKINLRLVAVGATLDLNIRLYPATGTRQSNEVAHYEGTPSNLTYNSKQEVHEMLGGTDAKGVMINTDNGAKARPITIQIDKGNYDPAHMPLAIWSQTQGEMRLARTGLPPYGIIIPGNVDWSWPKEQIRITSAYPNTDTIEGDQSFTKYGESLNEAENWYKYPATRLIMNEASLGF